MRRGGIAPAAALVAAALLPSAARAADPLSVSIQFSAFAPQQVELLPGETVQWSNVSERRHTVTADDGSFASDELLGGSTFAQRFDDVGAHPYHCSVHPTMTGEVDVRRVTLAPLPPSPVPAGSRVELTGRTADPAEPVRVERADGAGFTTIATAAPAPDGSWRASIAATRTVELRAASDEGFSGLRRLLVSDRRVAVAATRRGVAVTVAPPLPNARVVLQQELRERFGWWPARSARLDFTSQASFRVRRPARVRVVLVGRDGWTPLATSRVLRLGALRAGRARR